MTYEQYVIEVFKDHNDSMGLSEEETNDFINESTFSRIEKYLTKNGYNLAEMYSNDNN